MGAATANLFMNLLHLNYPKRISPFGQSDMRLDEIAYAFSRNRTCDFRYSVWSMWRIYWLTCKIVCFGGCRVSQQRTHCIAVFTHAEAQRTQRHTSLSLVCYRPDSTRQGRQRGRSDSPILRSPCLCVR